MRLIGVGVGPGDPELVTVKAVRVLRDAGRVFVPVLDAATGGHAEAIVRAHAGHDRIERVVFALNERSDAARRRRHWDLAGARVAAWLADTRGVAAFATIGDPNVYSTFTYLAQTVGALAPGVVVETVPGITAMQALAAASGTPLVEGRERLTLLPLTHGVEPLRQALAGDGDGDGDGTVVVYKGGRHLPDITAVVKETGREATYGSHLGLPTQTVSPLADVDAEAPYLSTVLVPARRRGRGGAL
jgi:precorrin-2/cobalt-factor-2 C20-methyltransferase